MAAHAYWRVYITANNGNQYVCIAEIEMRATVGGTDQANGGTAIASDSTDSDPPANAFDNDDLSTASHVWAAIYQSDPHWIGYHFVAPVAIAEVAIWSQNWPEGPSRAPKDFTIECSDDGVSWAPKLQVSGASSWSTGTPNVYVIQSTFRVSGTVAVAGTLTQRRVLLYSRPVGIITAPAVLGQAMSDANTGAYQIDFEATSNRGVMGVADDDYGTAWASDTAYAVYDLIYPLTPNGHYYKCTTAGTSGGAEPSWSGSTVSDGAISWADQGTMRAPEVQGPFIPALVV